MGKGYLRRLLQYLSRVYDISGKINKVKDKRNNPRIPTATICFAVFIGFMLKIRSFNQLDDWLEHKDFRRIVSAKMKLPRIDVIRDSLKVMDVKDLEAFLKSVIKQSIKNKIVRKGTIDNHKVVGLDGVELFESINKSCENCLTRVIRGTPHYYHRCVVAAYVGKDPNIVLGQEMLFPKLDSSNKDEGEMTAAKRLMQNLHKHYGNFADIVVYDALACNAPWINTIKSYSMDSVIRVKNRRLNIVKTAAANFKSRPFDKTWIYSESHCSKTTISAWETTVTMNGVDSPLRYVKFLKKVTDKKTNKSKYTQIFIITTSHAISLETLYKIYKARFEIENNVFRQLKTQWHMDHCFIHDKNGLEATLMFMIIAFNLMQLFFFRRMNTFRLKKLLQVEVIERIIKEMVVYDAQGKYLLDTG